MTKRNKTSEKCSFMMQSPGVIVLLLCVTVVGFAVVCDGENIQDNNVIFRAGRAMDPVVRDNDVIPRTKRGMSPAVKGVLAWRKLLWNSKPGGAQLTTNRLSYGTYHKAGDFSDATKDFLAVVPDAIKTRNAKGKTVYEGTVGDRRVILREGGGGLNGQHPYIEIKNKQGTDKVFYMGKGWNKYDSP